MKTIAVMSFGMVLCARGIYAQAVSVSDTGLPLAVLTAVVVPAAANTRPAMSPAFTDTDGQNSFAPAPDPQAKDDLFAGIEKLGAKAKDSSEVTLDKNTLGLAARKSGQVGDLAKKADLVMIRNYEFANEGDYNMADVEQYQNRLTGDGWQHTVRTRSKREITDIAVRYDKDGQTKETVIINAEPKELSIIHIVGPLSVKDLGKLRQGAGVE